MESSQALDFIKFIFMACSNKAFFSLEQDNVSIKFI